jgi:hypothetical protein
VDYRVIPISCRRLEFIEDSYLISAGVRRGCEQVAGGVDCNPADLKPTLILRALRGAEAPLFHVTAPFPSFSVKVIGRWPLTKRRCDRYSLRQ